MTIPRVCENKFKCCNSKIITRVSYTADTVLHSCHTFKRPDHRLILPCHCSAQQNLSRKGKGLELCRRRHPLLHLPTVHFCSLVPSGLLGWLAIIGRARYNRNGHIFQDNNMFAHNEKCRTMKHTEFRDIEAP